MSATTGEASTEQKRSGTLIDTVQTKAQEVAKEDFAKAKVLIGSAAKGGSWFYPFKGIFYFFTHQSLWKPLLSKLVPTISLAVGVTAGMLAFTYLPQLAVMVIFNGPLAVVTTVLLVLNESSMIVNILSRNFMLQDAILDTFDGTLVAKDCANIVSEGRQMRPGSDPLSRLGKVIKSPFQRFTPKAFIRYFVYLPLNFIPVVGTVVVILLQGRARGRSVHDRYFQLKKWSASQRAEWLQEHAGPYGAFGTVATVLEMIPVVSILFTFTNAVGAALWAADIEQKGTEMTHSTAPNLRDAAKKAE